MDRGVAGMLAERNVGAEVTSRRCVEHIQELTPPADLIDKNRRSIYNLK